MKTASTETPQKESCERFTLYKAFSSRGRVYLMAGLNKTSADFDDLLSIACCFAKKGHIVKVLAPIHYKDSLYGEIFGPLSGTVYYRKCPDLLIDNLFYEYESYRRPFMAKKIGHMIKRGAEQSSRLIIDNNKGASDRFIVNMVLKRINNRANKNDILELFVYEKGAVRRVYKKKKAVGSLGSPRSTNP